MSEEGRESDWQNPSEMRNPRDGASVLSLLFLWWFQDVLKLGSKQPLTDKDLLPLLEDYKAEMLIQKAEKYWLDELNRSRFKSRKPRLWKALFRLISWRASLAIIILRILCALSYAFLPFCLWLVLRTLNETPNVDTKLAFFYVALLGVTSVIKALSTQHFDYLSELWALKLKVAVIGLVYKKVLSLNRYGLESKLSGNIINLVSNDAQKVEKCLNQLGMVLSVPLELTISLVILWYLIGWEAFIGAGLFFMLVTFQILMVRKAAKLRQKAAAFTDKRLAVINEIITGIRAVKMYAWEWNFRDVLNELRRKEMSIIRLKGFIMSTVTVLFYVTLPIAALISVATLTLTGTQVSSFAVFTLLLGLVTIRFIFCVNLGTSFYIVAEAKVALDRIQAFLKERVSNLEGKVDVNDKTKLLLDKSGNVDDNLTVHYKTKERRARFRKRRDLPAENFKPSVSVGNEGISSSYFYKAPSETCADQPGGGLNSSEPKNVSSTSEPILSISNATCSWDQSHLINTLCGITFSLRKGEMFAITGAVGSGKSSLLTAILGELPLREGTVSLCGKVAYVPQIPWVFSGTVRENILFGLPFHETRFQKVVQVCGLTKDLIDFTKGDRTEIGQQGVTLSGGQKARVALARAVYSHADIYLLDDPLSAVDTKVGSKLFDSCILGELSGRIRLLVTHQLQYLKNVHRIAVLEKGTLACQGSYDELRAKGAFGGIVELSEPCENETRGSASAAFEGDVEKLLQEPSAIAVLSVKGQPGHECKESLTDGLDLEKGVTTSPDCDVLEMRTGQERCGKGEFEKVLNAASVSRVSPEKGLSDSSLDASVIIPREGCEKPDVSEIGAIEKIPDEPVIPPNSNDKRNIGRSFPFDKGLEKALYLVLCEGELEEEGIGQSETSGERLDEVRDKGTLKVLNGPSRLPVSCVKGHPHHKDNAPVADILESPELEVDDTMTPENVERLAKTAPESEHGKVHDFKESDEHKSTGTVTWRLYWKYFRKGLSVPMIVLFVLLLVLGQVCLLAPNWWLAKMAEMSRDDQKAPITQVIHACLVAVSIVVMATSSFLFYYLLLKASENLHNEMTKAIISAPVLFFDTNPAGRILNRFSKDVGCMDDELPLLFLTALMLCLFSFFAIVVPAATNYWLFLALLPIIGIYIYFGRYFLKSSRELKRIEAMRCSPVYSHVSETVNGLEIVHSSNMSETFVDRLQRYQDDNTQAFFMVVSCNRWLSVRLDLLSSAFVIVVAVGAILVTENPALAGLALTYAIQTLDGTQYGIRLAAQVENLMTSVERVMTYTEIEPEPGYSTDARPPESWLTEGRVDIQDLSLVYFEGGPRVLKDISFCVCSKEKVGVVGRTGAGKSSLVSALFRMPEPFGKVLIDDVDITSINLQKARRSMAVITQDPVLFGGTLRRNMDPFSQYTDQEIWTALEEVQLKARVQYLPEQLKYKLREAGSNLSVGERQLVCLARALVQKSKIIILDEATANVDFNTDRLIQRVIRDKFKDSTVLTIAHRLNTIMDYDKVLVLDGGRVVEFDKPGVLIRNGGLFAELVSSHNKSVKH